MVDVPYHGRASYQPVYAQGSLVHPMPLLDTPNSINDRAIADRLAVTLGERPAAMMKSHGAVTVGKDIVEALLSPTISRRTPTVRYMALQIGKPYVFSEQEIMLCREKLWTPNLFSARGIFRAKLPALE